MKCPLCASSQQKVIYSNPSVPAFQNKVYKTHAQALSVASFQVELGQCTKCGFIWNRKFNADVMEYDSDYQNEQGFSPTFACHLDDTRALVESLVEPGGKIIEVGCGKGAFVSRLKQAGFQVKGYDPAYEGEDPAITKQYFDRSLEVEQGDLVVLRHTLEHVPAPLDFLKTIKAANRNQGKILIEVPRFEWIAEKCAFWDIFHEHCNYFTERSLSSLFTTSTIRTCFGGQYMWLVAELNTLIDNVTTKDAPKIYDGGLFSSEINRFKKYISTNPGCVLWGAGAKGAAFGNTTDPDGTILAGIIDINPKKQGCYIAKSGHSIFHPNALHSLGAGNVLIMNENYEDEIRAMCAGFPNKLLTMGCI